MTPPSRRDILRASGLAVTVTIPGCFGTPASDTRGSPTAAPTNTPARGTAKEPTDVATTTSEPSMSEERRSPTDSTDRTSTTEESPDTDANSGTEESTGKDEATTTEESTEEETRTPDCTLYDIHVHNDTSRTISVSLRILEGWGNEDDGDDDPVASTPTPKSTPNVVFSDSFRLGKDGWQDYDDIPDREGRHRLEVDVEDGPRRTENVHARDWEDTSVIMIDIESGHIRIGYAEQARPKGCD